MEHYDLIIIGGGAGAFAAAIKANDLKCKTALINEGLPLGGTCVNVGCVPSKTLLHAAELVHTAKHHGVRGIELSVDNADYRAVVADEIALVEQLRGQKYEQVMKSLEYVTLITGRASFVTEHSVKVGDKTIEADKFIVATGSTAIVPNIEGLIEAGYITHNEVMALKSVPASLAIIGAGPVGLELAQMYARFGSQVTLVQRSKSIMPSAESELTNKLQQILEAEGISIKTNSHIKQITNTDSKKLVCYTNGSNEQTVVVDEILLAAGKQANTADLHLENAGVQTDDKQLIQVEHSLQTSRPHIFAVGDVTNLPLRLETTAGKEGSYAVENAMTGSTHSVGYDSVPWTVFTDPQLASVGYTEERQMKELKVCACRTITFDKLPKALITKRIEGVIKMAIHPETKVIMGVHILGADAGDLIAQAMVLVKNKNTIDDVLEMLPVFPTMSEALKLVAMSFTRDISKLSCCI